MKNDWQSYATAAVAIGCVVASAGACLIAGGALLAEQTVHEMITTGRVDWANFGVNAEAALRGGGLGRMAAR